MIQGIALGLLAFLFIASPMLQAGVWLTLGLAGMIAVFSAIVFVGPILPSDILLYGSRLVHLVVFLGGGYCIAVIVKEAWQDWRNKK